MTKLKPILMAILFAFGQILGLPALAAGDSHPTGFDAGAEIALANFDCPAGLACPAAEGAASQVYPGGIPSGILVAQSDGYHYEGSKLDGFFLDTLAALEIRAWMDDFYHLAEFHSDDVDVQEVKENWRENYRECVRLVNRALADLNAHQREHDLPVSREHPTVSCPTEEPGQ